MDTPADAFEQKLVERKETLKNCQTDKQTNSCLQCEQFFQCEIRKAYVSAVYASMNKGGSGGFDF
ncbi:MAG: hypothetical protein LBN32_02580 [Helicobacteraceae bacterium]|jgi:hypothetical protein|nr:hypothetical protein [Helicobacteraceae bacterium]